ncbi:hypothetical protein [Pseudomonas paralcaligenes]|uniref:hypothetical protein n=1 Tax=Pseudomonas paralcaligenes TaxID=2772558 RepID=UPI001C80D459|nr:hypothetical protein [Pseudomonas paralcaligenes]
MSDIKPTVGRVLHFHPSREFAADRGMVLLCQGDPMDAHLVYVHRSGLVNLAVFDHAGNQHAIADVKLLQDADLASFDEHGQLIESYCTWMPFQKGQAAKTEALESKLAGYPAIGTAGAETAAQGDQELLPIQLDRTLGTVAMTDAELHDELRKPIATLRLDMGVLRQGKGARFALRAVDSRMAQALSNLAGCGKCIGQCQGHATLAGEASGSLASPAAGDGVSGD